MKMPGKGLRWRFIVIILAELLVGGACRGEQLANTSATQISTSEKHTPMVLFTAETTRGDTDQRGFPGSLTVTCQSCAVPLPSRPYRVNYTIKNGKLKATLPLNQLALPTGQSRVSFAFIGKNSEEGSAIALLTIPQPTSNARGDLNNGGNHQQEKSQVGAENQTPQDIQFFSNSPEIDSGDNVVLGWKLPDSVAGVSITADGKDTALDRKPLGSNGEISVKPLSTTTYTLTATDSGNIIKKEIQVKVNPKAPPPTPLAFLTPYLTILTLSSLALILAILARLFYQWIAIRQRRRHQIAWVTSEQLADVNLELKNIKSIAEEGLKRANALDPAVGESLLPKISALAADLQRLKRQFEAFPQPMEHRSVDDQLQEVVEFLRSRDQHNRSTSNTAGGFTVASGPAALAAVVNEWIDRNSKDRRELLTLAKSIGVPEPRLANIRKASSSPGGFSRSDNSFDFDENGSWLFSPVPGVTSDFWAAPADIRAFGMGTTTSQLEDLFDGMQDYTSEYKFEAIYLPCLLRKSGDQYSLQRRGALKLVASRPPASASRPAPYSSFSRSFPPSTQTARRDGELARLLTAWFRERDNERNYFNSEIAKVRAGAQGLTELRELKELFNFHESDINALRSNLGQLQQRLEEIALARSAPRPVTQHVDNPISSDSSAIITPPAVKAPSPLFPPPVVASFSSEVRRQAQVGLPVGWKAALRAAADRQSSRPDLTDSPEEALYLVRLQESRNALKSHLPGTPFGIVHIRKDAGNLLQIHFLSEVNLNDVTCPVCGSISPYQFAITAGAHGAETVYILFPFGKLAKSKFSAIYSALADDLPSVFSTENYEPAELKLQDRANSGYSVNSKMRLTSSPGGGA